MAFDSAKYKNTVLLPLAKDKSRLEILQHVIRDVQGDSGVDAAGKLDLVELYAVDASMGTDDLVRHFASLNMAYNKQQNLPSAQLLAKLLGLLDDARGRTTDPAFWAGLAKARRQALDALLAEFARAAAKELPLRVAVFEQVAEQAKGAGLGHVSENDLAAALRKQGVEVCPDFELPRTTVPNAIRKVTDFPEFRTIVDVILRPARPTEIAVVGEVVPGSSSRPLDPGDVRRAKALLQQQEAQIEDRARQAAQNALGALTHYKSSAELHEVLLSALAETTEALIRRGMPKVLVRDELVRRGLRQSDASRLVTKLSASTQVLSLNDVLERLSAGALADARRVLQALVPRDGEDESEWSRHDALVTAAEARKSQLIRQYEGALASRNYVVAAEALRAAIGVDQEDEELTQQLRSLPPLPPSSISLRTDGRAIDLTWSSGGDDAVRYTVVRTAAAVPVSPSDGHILARDHAEPHLRDEVAPIATSVRYSVFATRDGVSYSDPTGTATTLLPPPVDLRASTSPNEVALSWSTPPEATTTTITQFDPDGSRRQHQPTTPGQLVVPKLATGRKYRFAARAIYLLSDGERRESAAIEVDATPRGLIEPVRDLEIAADGSGNRHWATWTAVVGYSVELWAFPLTAEIDPGARHTFGGMEGGGGQRLPLGPGAPDQGARVTRQVTLLPVLSLIVPVTVDGDGGLLGSGCVAGSAPAIERPTAERFGDELRISLVWPRVNCTVEVTWVVDGRSASKRVSRGAYNDGGGIRLAEAASVQQVALAAVVSAGHQEWLSPRVPVPIGGTSPTVGYTLDVRKPRLGRHGSVTVGVESQRFRGRLEVVTVVREARFLPSGPSDGREIDRRSLDLTSGEALSFELGLGRVKPPFWVRLFTPAGAEVRLVDPPTSQMRG